jgi:hypothetical protein
MKNDLANFPIFYKKIEIKENCIFPVIFFVVGIILLIGYVVLTSIFGVWFLLYLMV